MRRPENKEIAKKAKVDIASINYHFGSRKGLFEAVLIRAHQNLVSLEALEAIQRSDMTPEEKLRGVFNLITGAARRGERASLQVISRSVIAPGAALETLFKEEARPKLQVILQIVSEITGFPVGDPRLIHCIASAIAPAFLFFVFGSRFPGPFGALTKMPQSELDDRLTVFALGDSGRPPPRPLQSDRRKRKGNAPRRFLQGSGYGKRCLRFNRAASESDRPIRLF